ncbi:MAG: hypothetical protein HDS14_07740 [Bacteroides sp.]|nr:hypothetical protein [Bacteroides sp.]
MKRTFVYLTTLLMISFSSCSNQDEPSPVNEGSPRDWSYGKEQVQFYIDNVEQTSVSEITVRSLQLEGSGDNDVFPWYDATLKVKGLLPKNKVFNIQVLADVERFEGSTVYDGVEYNVTGEYTGNPFEHYKDMGIIIYLVKK